MISDILSESFYGMLWGCGNMCLGVESVSIFLVVVVGVEGENYWGIWLFFL